MTEARQLLDALTEQARRAERFEQSLGTTGEFNAYARLRAARCAVTGSVEHTAAPPGHWFVFSVACDRRGPGTARAELARRLAGSVDTTAIQTAMLLLSEVVTNAVTHGTLSASGTLDVEVDVCGDRLWLGVSNSGPAFDHVPVLPHEDDSNGRGLCVVDALARDWGTGHARGTTSVWFEMDSRAAVAA